MAADRKAKAEILKLEEELPSWRTLINTGTSTGKKIHYDSCKIHTIGQVLIAWFNDCILVKSGQIILSITSRGARFARPLLHLICISHRVDLA